MRWVSENYRPYDIVTDRAFVMLMKTGRPEYKLPSPSTVSRDVQRVFERCRTRIAKMLQVSRHEHVREGHRLTLLQDFAGELNYTFDAWTSPNHKALIAFAVHLHHEGEPLTFLLDVIEVAESHTGETMARVFHDMMRSFKITEKVSRLPSYTSKQELTKA